MAKGGPESPITGIYTVIGSFLQVWGPILGLKKIKCQNSAKIALCEWPLWVFSEGHRRCDHLLIWNWSDWPDSFRYTTISAKPRVECPFWQQATVPCSTPVILPEPLPKEWRSLETVSRWVYFSEHHESQGKRSPRKYLSNDTFDIFIWVVNFIENGHLVIWGKCKSQFWTSRGEKWVFFQSRTIYGTLTTSKTRLF